MDLLERIAKAYAEKGLKAFDICGSNGGDAVHYHLRIGDKCGITFSNHGHIDLDGLNIYKEHPLYVPKMVEW